MKFIADMHTHTISSGHAYSTLAENCMAARKRGHTHIVLSDHAPSMIGAPQLIYFMASTPKYAEGIRVIKGAETNVLNEDGELDLPEMALKRLEYVIASMHEICWNPKDSKAVTRAWLNILDNPYVDCLGHVGNSNFPFDMEEVIKKCREKGKIIEINNHSFDVRKGSDVNCREVARLCMKYGVNIVVSSDAHYMDEVGVFDNSVALLEELGFPEEQVLNADAEKLRRYFKERKGIEI
jgi:putative hydrolase